MKKNWKKDNYVVCKCYDTVLLNKEKETIPSTDNMPDNLVMARVARQDIQNRNNHIKNNKVQIFNIKNNGSEVQIFVFIFLYLSSRWVLHENMNFLLKSMFKAFLNYR